MPRRFLFDDVTSFADRVIVGFRFGQDKETRAFIESILKTAEGRKKQIGLGGKLWRAQLGHDDIVSVGDDDGEWAYDLIRPHSPERMTPSSRFVRNGRANPVGIAYWYCATDSRTAIAEMRPWKSAKLTVGELRATREIQLVDCISDCPPGELSGPQGASRRERNIWKSIGRAFSQPVEPAAVDVEYAPTQLIAEAFKAKGFDGIEYESQLGDGRNVVVFDLSAFAIDGRELWTATDVKYDLKCDGGEIHVG